MGTQKQRERDREGGIVSGVSEEAAGDGVEEGGQTTGEGWSVEGPADWRGGY